MAHPGPALSTLLREAVDYAGLFPPAGLAMPAAAENYARYLASDDAWALGRFVVPAARLEELASSARAHWGGRAPWRVSALVNDVGAELPLVGAFNAAHPEARVDTIEVKASSLDAIDALRVALAQHGDLATFVEIPVAHDPEPLVAAIARAGLRAKIRTGGVTPDAFPAAAHVVRFLGACLAHRVPFKATAGLHHPLRGEYRLTYAADAARAPMYGFLNVFLASALLRAGCPASDAEALLLEQSPGALRIDDDAITWRAHRFDAESLASLRAQLAGFGSCSFREPIDDLTTLGFL